MSLYLIFFFFKMKNVYEKVEDKQKLNQETKGEKKKKVSLSSALWVVWLNDETKRNKTFKTKTCCRMNADWSALWPGGLEGWSGQVEW